MRSPVLRYVIPGTEIAYGAVRLRARSAIFRCYGMPGTDIPVDGIGLYASYAMSGTDKAYAGTRAEP
eukprot:3767350-Rhodomonas_salina.1